jgi:hypothetical protein
VLQLIVKKQVPEACAVLQLQLILQCCHVSILDGNRTAAEVADSSRCMGAAAAMATAAANMLEQLVQ